MNPLCKIEFLKVLIALSWSRLELISSGIVRFLASNSLLTLEIHASVFCPLKMAAVSSRFNPISWLRNRNNMFSVSANWFTNLPNSHRRLS